MSERAAGASRPILLAAGIARFDILVQGLRTLLPSPEAVRWYNRILGDALGYFRYVGRALAERGFEVHETSVSFAGSLERRARDLQRAVERVLGPGNPQGQVNIIAHSMGGLDARYMIARLGMAERVASLVTIGTPHLGTSFADWRYDERQASRRVIEGLEGLGVDFTGSFDLTTKRCRAFCAFNEAAEAANGVTYIAYAGVQEDRGAVFWPLRRSWDIVREREGANDGLVAAASQLWQPELNGPTGAKRVEQRTFPLPADHLNECAWWHPCAAPITRRRQYERTIRDVYVAMAEDLRARGLYG
jgi:triacylglycerol lipase